ncbi:MAG TPA: 3-dehydroquinate synthase [Casimicrobiaceae bacterium]|nr:3-dehydroquinate synthase [Casimicrobiaceae bacterium]
MTTLRNVPTRTLVVALAERSYPIHIGAALLNGIGELLPATRSARAVIVTNPVVAAHHLDPLQKGLERAGMRYDVIVVPDGEAHKDWAALYQIHTRLLELKAERSTMLIALGGGVIGDLAGFAAATYQRGMPLVQIPTTLLAQVDSSVGGKTAVNHPLGKNMIGAFYQPVAVIIDTATLASLPAREYVSGLAEVVKYGAIRCAELFAWLEESMEALLARDEDAMAHAVVESCRIKAEIVAVDERETGERALLNFGHTFGHAIEVGTGYGTWLHGEAVAAGMVLAAELSLRISGLPRADHNRLQSLLARAGLPTRAPPLGVERYLELISRDKKVEASVMRFILLEALGRATIGTDVADEDLRGVLPD